jgi:hypothetical protein
VQGESVTEFVIGNWNQYKFSYNCTLDLKSVHGDEMTLAGTMDDNPLATNVTGTASCNSLKTWANKKRDFGQLQIRLQSLGGRLFPAKFCQNYIADVRIKVPR